MPKKTPPKQPQWAQLVLVPAGTPCSACDEPIERLGCMPRRYSRKGRLPSQRHDELICLSCWRARKKRKHKRMDA